MVPNNMFKTIDPTTIGMLRLMEQNENLLNTIRRNLLTKMALSKEVQKDKSYNIPTLPDAKDVLSMVGSFGVPGLLGQITGTLTEEPTMAKQINSKLETASESTDVKKEYCEGNSEDTKIESDLSDISPELREELLRKKISKKKKRVNTCGHPEREHYAKSLCYNCYHRRGRTKKPWNCNHERMYAQGLCQNCYINEYNRKRRVAEQMKKQYEDMNPPE
jgi:hypothetical protein